MIGDWCCVRAAQLCSALLTEPPVPCAVCARALHCSRQRARPRLRRATDHCFLQSLLPAAQLTIGLRSCQDNLGYNWIFRHQTFRSTRVHQAKQKNEGRRQTYNSQPQKKNSGRRRCAYVGFFSQLCREVQLYSSQNKVGKIMGF